MNPFDGNETSSTELRELKSEIREWALGIRCVFVVLNVLPLYYCTRVLLMVPEFEQLFEEQLGSKHEHSILTRMVLDHSQPLLELMWLLVALAVLLILAVKKTRHVRIIALAGIAVLMTTGLLTARALFIPLMTSSKNLSGGSKSAPGL